MSYNNAYMKPSNPREYPAMDKKELKLLYEILNAQSNSSNEAEISELITKKLSKMRGVEFVVEDGNIIAKKGEASNGGLYPYVICHIDTVYSIQKGFNIVQVKSDSSLGLVAFNENLDRVGIGGDDKCGVYACLKLLENIKTPIKAIFFSREEVGCIGSNSINIKNLSDAAYILGIDRWGRTQVVDRVWGHKITSEEFNKDAALVMAKFGYGFNEGMLTDAVKLSMREVGVSCVNISCGYYKHHTQGEMIVTNELKYCVWFVTDLIKTLGSKRYEHKRIDTDIPKYRHYDSFDAEDYPYSGSGISKIIERNRNRELKVITPKGGLNVKELIDPWAGKREPRRSIIPNLIFKLPKLEYLNKHKLVWNLPINFDCLYASSLEICNKHSKYIETFSDEELEKLSALYVKKNGRLLFRMLWRDETTYSH